MARPRTRLILLIAVLPTVMFISAVIYMFGMAHLEGDPRTFLESLAWAAETLSTTGYGVDGRWQHPAMVGFIIVLQFFGVFLVFLVFPIYLIPFLEERFEARLPTEVPPMRDHVVIYHSGPAVETLLEELRRAGIDVLVVEDRENVARRLMEMEHIVLFGDLEDDVLQQAHLLQARSLIANSSDDEDAALVLAARQMGFEGEILALVDEPFHRKPILLAGADGAYTPRHALGAALAARASQKVHPTVKGAQALGHILRVSEVRLADDSELVGKTLAETDIGRRTGATVIGQWLHGHLEAPVGPNTRLGRGAILVILGSVDAIGRLAEASRGTSVLPPDGPFIIAGCGEVGTKVRELLVDAGEQVIVIDRNEGEGVDIVGDILEPDVIERADVGRAHAIILALDTDSATVFATVILKDVAPHVPIIARVNRADNVERIRRAGADFSQSLSQVSGQILAGQLLGESSISVDPQLKVIEVDASPFVGRNPKELGIREKTGCSVVAIERDEDLICDFHDDVVVRTDDRLYLCGPNDGVRAFHRNFGTSG